MSEVRFICPACGQHIECDDVSAGQIAPCPSCAAQIRVPGEPHPAEAPAEPPASAPFVDPKSELVSYTPIEPSGESPESKEASGPGASSVKPEEAPPASARKPDPRPPVSAPVNKVEFKCVCPVCQAELQVEISPKSAIASSHTEPIHKPLEPAKRDPVSLDEREEKIAAAREANPIQTYPAMKPRLDYVLKGEPPPKPKDDGRSLSE